MICGELPMGMSRRRDGYATLKHAYEIFLVEFGVMDS